ncbi:MAG: uracil phosphoribosyltransferase [Planctomycetota bacterium]|nr:MAG: uracil phosphoribosyltransferase [Planctomycetota bacterium]
MSGLRLCQHPLALHRLAELRDRATPPARFRHLVRELSWLLAVDATRELALRPRTVRTPLGECPGGHLAESVVLVPVLRAGLGMVDGVLDLLPEAEVWHLGLHRDERTLRPIEYYALPNRPPPQLCLVLDPMLATGGSAAAAIAGLRGRAAPCIAFVGILGAPEGVRRLQQEAPDVPLHLVAVDERLNEYGFIVPGLGDAGDRQFGTL